MVLKTLFHHVLINARVAPLLDIQVLTIFREPSLPIEAKTHLHDLMTIVTEFPQRRIISVWKRANLEQLGIERLDDNCNKIAIDDSVVIEGFSFIHLNSCLGNEATVQTGCFSATSLQH